MQSMAKGGEGSSQGLGAKAAPDMAQMFQAMARQFVMVIIDLRREAPVKRIAVARSNTLSDSTFLRSMETRSYRM
jgi:UV DNA damage repair endonuclease